MKPFRCIIVAEGESDGEVHEFDSLREMKAFAHGVSEGSGRYGCGSCGVYCREDINTNLCEVDEHDQPIICEIEKYLPEDESCQNQK